LNSSDGTPDAAGGDGFDRIEWADASIDGDDTVSDGIDEDGTVQGSYGILTVNADGDYSYSATSTAIDNLVDGATLQDVFNYTIYDSDGDSDTSALTITLTGDNDPPVGSSQQAIVSDEGLTGGNQDSLPAETTPPGGDNTDSASDSGSFSFTDPDSDPITYNLSLTGLPNNLTSGITWAFEQVNTGTEQEPVWEDNTKKIIGSVDTNGQDEGGVVPVMTITVADNGGWTVTQHEQFDHSDPNTEDEHNFNVKVIVADDDGGSTDTTLAINVEDDRVLSPTILMQRSRAKL
jgi:VCBS repeat-containing protein